MTIDTIMNPKTPTKEQTTAAVMATLAVAEAIRALGTVPSGHLYAQLCGKMDLAAYNGIIGTLKRAGLVSESANELRWIGPCLK